MSKPGDQSSKAAETNAVRVCVRVRPLSEKERNIGYQNCVAFDEPTKQVVLQAPSYATSKKHHNKPYHGFAFDHFYGPKDSASHIYEDCVSSLVENTTKGFNACVLAYGQTGSGKTHTMSGGTGILGMDDQGIIPEAIEQLFKSLKKVKKSRECEGEEVTIKVTAAALEIYNEELKDLGASSSSSGQSAEASERPMSSRPLTARRGSTKLEIRDSRNKQSGFSTEVVGLSETEFTCAKDTLRFFTRASRHRSTASTMMNDLSSRSHAIFSVTVEQTAVKYMDKSGNPVPLEMAKSSWWTRNGGSKRTNSTMSRLNLVDLAGSERVKKSGVEGKELKEASSINSGLLVLGNVISALADRSEGKAAHIPYRDVKLTRLLQDSLGGNSLTTLISCISPSENDFDETFNTLQYANRACKIKNVPLSNSWNQVVEEMSTVPENHSSMMSMLQSQLDSPVGRKRGLRRRDINSVTEDLIEVPLENGKEKGFSKDFQSHRAAAVAKRSRAAQYDLLRRKALGGMGSKVKDFKKNSTITGKEIHLREREQQEIVAPTQRSSTKLLRKSVSPTAAGVRCDSRQAEKPRPVVSVSNTGAGKQMSFAAWMASMQEEESDDDVEEQTDQEELIEEGEEVEQADEQLAAESLDEEVASMGEEEVVTADLKQLRVESELAAEEVTAKPKDDLSSGHSVEVTVDVAGSHHVDAGSEEEADEAVSGHEDVAGSEPSMGESIEDYYSDVGDELEDEEEDGLVMADEIEDSFGREPLKYQRSTPQTSLTSTSDATEAVARPAPQETHAGESEPMDTLTAAGAEAESVEEAGTSGRGGDWVEGASDDGHSEEDAEVLVRFRVNQHIAVTVHKACTKDDFEEVVSLLPENTPLPSSDRMIYLLARVIEDMETGEVGRAVGCLMASIGTCMISSCIYSFEEPAEVEVYSTEERVELWGLQIPQPSTQLQEMMSAAGEPPLKEWSSVDRLTMSIGLLFGLCCYADDNDIQAGFCVPRPQLLDRWISAGVPMHGLDGQMQLIYPSHAHDYHYYKSSTVAYFLVDEVIETLGFILAFL